MAGCLTGIHASVLKPRFVMLAFKGAGGNGRGGIPHWCERYNVCPQWRCDTTPGPSRECDIAFFV